MSDDTIHTNADFKTLTAEAHELGIQYTGDDADELTAFIAMARAERGKEHPVACYGLSYDQTDRRCRICQLRNPCADLDKRPRVVVMEAKLQPIPCDVCGKGMLEVECVETETGILRDYACSTKGCPNTLAIQAGWESVGNETVREIVLGEPEAEEEAPEPEVAADPETPKKKPELRVVKGGKDDAPPAKKAAKKKVVVKKTTKKKTTEKAAAKAPAKKAKKAPSKKAPSKKVVVKRPEQVELPVISGQLRFQLIGGEEFSSLTKLVNHVTESRNWSPRKFFGVDPKSVKPGDKLERTFKGTTYKVEVIGS